MSEDIEVFGRDPEELASLSESVKIHVSDCGESLPKGIREAVESLPSRHYITRKMEPTELGWLRNKLRELWKFITGKDISDFHTVESPKSAKDLDGNFWLLPGGIAVSGYNHFSAAKRHKGMLCALLDINPFIMERHLSGDPHKLIAFLLANGAVRMHIDRANSEVMAQTSEESWPWAREKLRKMVHGKKLVRVLDPKSPYMGWKSGIPIRIR